MRYRAVGFDYGGVIGGVGVIGKTFVQDVCELLGVDSKTFLDAYYKLNHKIQTGEVDTWDEFWKIFLDAFGQSEKLDEVLALNHVLTVHWGIVDKDMLGLVDKLRDKGYKTGLLSNATVANGRDMRKQGLHEHFDVFHISAEKRLMKPNPEFFIGFYEELGVSPHELVFIDDSEKSLSTAEECGFTPVLFTNYEDLIVELKRLKIL